MKKRILALVLAAVMAFGLVACGDVSAPAAEQTPAPTAAPTAAPSNVDLSVDIITYSAGVAPDAALLTVNGERVKAVPLIVEEGAEPLTFRWFCIRVMEAYLAS